GALVSLEDWEKRRDARGGFVQSVKMINVVHSTQCAHLPEAFHPAALASGISTWYTQVKYGRVSFAVISDRFFKSGPQMIRKGEGRIDHIFLRPEPDELESPELTMIGDPQM